jgi:hypothetical protein
MPNLQAAGSERDQRTSQEFFACSACTVFVCISHTLLVNFKLAKSSNTIVMSLTIFHTPVCARVLTVGGRLKLTLQELEHLRSNEKRYESESADWLHNHSALFERLLRHGRDGH